MKIILKSLEISGVGWGIHTEKKGKDSTLFHYSFISISEHSLISGSSCDFFLWHLMWFTSGLDKEENSSYSSVDFTVSFEGNQV